MRTMKSATIAVILWCGLLASSAEGGGMGACLASEACRARATECEEMSRRICLGPRGQSAARCARRAQRECRRGIRSTCREVGACGANQSRPEDGCFIGGCSGQLCAEESLASTCEWVPWYACFRTARCERQADGGCAWTPTPELRLCLRERGGPPPR